ncbi:hypothetical protein ON010_g18268 [Phytophthora cinnamomi]|nr:hypothetical protein ON010_g18268 [Phytophthora cinnamomi]
MNGASDDWDSYLSLAELAYNSRFQQSISMAAFETDLGYLQSTPATLLSAPDTTSGAERRRSAMGKTFLELQADRLATVRRERQRASDRMSKYYDANSYLKPYERSGDREQRTFKVLLPNNTEGELEEDIVGYKRVRAT